MGNNVTIPNRQSFETMEQIKLDATVQTILQQGNVNFKDNVSTVSDLPTTGNEVNDFRMVLENWWVYRWDWVSWGILSVWGNLQSITVDISSSDILTMVSDPIEVLAAPWVGKVIVVTDWFMQFTAGNTPYTYASFMFLNMGGNTIFNLGNNITGWNVLKTSGWQSATLLENTWVVMTWGGSNPTNGDGTIKLTLTYKIVDLI